MGNPDGVWWIETRGQLACAEGVRFDPKALIAGLEVIANYLGKKLGEDTPLLNAQLPDGSRLAAVLPPVVRPGPAVTIRKFRQKRYTIEELIEAGSLTEEMANFLAGSGARRQDAFNQRRDRQRQDDFAQCACRFHSS